VAGLAANGLAAAERAVGERPAPAEPKRGAKSKKAARKQSGRKGAGIASSAAIASGAGVAAGTAMATAPSTVTRAAPVSKPPTAKAPAGSVRAGGSSSKTRRAGKKRRRALVRSLAIVAGLAVVAGGALGYDLLRSSGPVHTVTAPSRLLNYTLEPTLAKVMNAEALKANIVRAGHGEASNVVDGVYEVRSGPAAKGGPAIILFVGGHLSGSASSFISSFTGLLPGAFVTSPGPMAGQAACVPAPSGHLAECAWADNDTFGFIASPSLSATALSAELRQIRPLVEHTVK
jgi:hypothetical protein